jgi:anti-sigma B factor antagonist
VSAGTPWVRVRFVDLPVEIHRRSSEHREALRRELAFIEHAQAPDAAPARLNALTTELTARYGATTEAQSNQLLGAMAAGEERIELEYELPPDIVDATAHIGALLDELDDFCREGDLLTLVTPPDVRAYRLWILEELTAQIREGRAPRAWPGHIPGPATSATPDTETPAARVEVDDDLDLGTASDVRRALLDHIERGATDITVDLSACKFLDSTGLSLLVATHRRLVEMGGGLRIAGARDQVLGVLEMSGTSGFFGKG